MVCWFVLLLQPQAWKRCSVGFSLFWRNRRDLLPVSQIEEFVGLGDARDPCLRFCFDLSVYALLNLFSNEIYLN